MPRNTFIAFLIVLTSSTRTIAAPINIDALMQSKADAVITAKYNQCVANYKPKSPFNQNSVAKAVCELVVGKAPTKISNTSVTANGIGTQNLVVSPLPSIENIQTWTFNNCLDVPYPINQKMVGTASESLSITKKTTISSEKAINVGGEYDFKVPGAKFSASVSAKQVITNETGSTYASSNSRTIEETINISVPPRTMYVFKLEAVKYQATLDYFGDAALEASVYASKKLHYYSVLVPNNTVAINGSVASAFVSATKWDYLQYPANCSASLQKTATTQHSVSAQNLGLVDLNNSFLPYGFNDTAPKQVTKNIGKGLQITTANVVGSIQVRAKSSYAETCRASFFANNKQSKTILVPGVWSDWITLDTFVGTALPFVYTQDDCGGKITAQVKYFE